MNTATLELTLTPANAEAINNALHSVGGLITVAAAGLSHDAGTQLNALLRSGAQVDVHFHLEHGRTRITAAVEATPFFTITIGWPPPEEATRH